MTSRNEHTLTNWNRTEILLEEYRALYSLLTFRLEAIDQRIPLVAGAVVALLSSTSAFTQDQRLALLLGLPVACVWLHGTAVLHVRSKEDVLRRIDDIERSINGLAAEELLVFQSRHPNRQRVVGGRSGFGSVLALLSISIGSVAASSIMFIREFTPSAWAIGSFSAYAALCVFGLVKATWLLKGYQSLRPPPGVVPLFEIRNY